MHPPIFRTRITELFGIPHPILAGGLMWLADAAYVAAVVNAGGMGFITAASFPDPEAFRDEVRRCRDLTGGKRFGVNLSLSPRPEERERFLRHRQILCEEGVAFVETSGSSPEAILPALREAGIKVIHKVPAIRYALAADRLDLDAVAIVGAEAAGHPGVYMIGTMVQAALATDRLIHPVAIGGGIGSGRQLSAALAMGADAIVLGSRMLASTEIPAHPDYKRRIVEGDGTESVVTMRSFRNNHRVLANDSTAAVLELERAGVTDFAAYAPHVAGTVTRDAYRSGDLSRGMIDYGQAVAFVDSVETTEAIFDTLLDDAVAARRRLEAVSLG